MMRSKVQASKAKTQTWGRDNPFRAQLLARLGGQHRSPPTDRESLAIESKITLARETAEALAEPATPF